MTSGPESVVANAPGRGLEISTNQPGIQFYDGKYLNGSAIGHTDTPCGRRSRLCLEPQNFPDAPSHQDFLSCYLVPGEVYASRVRDRFTARQGEIENAPWHVQASSGQ